MATEKSISEKSIIWYVIKYGALKSSLIFSNDTGPGHIASLANNHIVWLLNDDKVSKANINDNETNHKILSSSVKNITSQKIIQYIEKYKLL